jgi:hypothetical protein
MVNRMAVVLLLAYTIASADSRPKVAAAKSAASAWAKAMMNVGDGKDFSKVEPLLADKFHAVVVKDTSLTCEVTATDRTKLPDALTCLRESNAVFRELRPWAKKDVKELWDPLREHTDEILALAKTDRVFIHAEQGEGMSVLAIIAVGVGPDKKPRIDAVYAAEVYN